MSPSAAARLWAITTLLLAGCEPLAATSPASTGVYPIGLLGLPAYPHLVDVGYDVSPPGGNQDQPVAALDPARADSLVIWRNTLDGRLYEQILSDKGQPLLPSSPLTPAAVNASEARLVNVPALDQYLLVFTIAGTTDDDVIAMRLSSAGVPIGQPFLAAWGNGDQRRPSVAIDPATSLAVVAWDDSRAGNVDVFCRTIALSATVDPVLGAECQVGSDPSGANETSPDIAYSPRSGIWMLAWEDGRNGPLDIVGQRLGRDAQPKGPNYMLVGLDQIQSAPRLGWNSVLDRFLLVFEDTSQGASDQNVRALQLNGQGMPAADLVDVSTQYGLQSRPRVAFDAASGHWLVTYDENLTGQSQVSARLLDGDATLLDSFAVSHDSGNDRDPEVVANPRLDEFAVFFAADPGSGANIRGQRVASK